ncbi:MAG: hypothetical protein U1E08_04260 [Coriobacteriia bacterium]|nr:hypothetical protein [Actinomycetota bacterium]MDZ4166890.1 hypothetical protein [Coriobacteriia bacterium]
MGRLRDMVWDIEALIVRKGLDEFGTKGRISANAGFVLSLVNDRTPDDPTKIERLRQAVYDVTGERI